MYIDAEIVTAALGYNLSSLDVTNNKNLDSLDYDEDTVPVIGWKKK